MLDEDGDHSRPVARQLVDAAPELVDRAVHGARDLADFVVAVIGQRRRRSPTA